VLSEAAVDECFNEATLDPALPSVRWRAWTQNQSVKWKLKGGGRQTEANAGLSSTLRQSKASYGGAEIDAPDELPAASSGLNMRSCVVSGNVAIDSRTTVLKGNRTVNWVPCSAVEVTAIWPR
jgi:hypothetical protein